MSSDPQFNPFGNQQGLPVNPYSSPQYLEPPLAGLPLIEAVKRKVQAPAIFLVICGILGMLAPVGSVVLVVALSAANANQNADPEGLELIAGQASLIVHYICFFVGLTVIVGAVQMMRVKIRAMGFVAAVLAMLNCSGGCCLIGIPAGIWALVILCQSDVARAFDENY